MHAFANIWAMNSRPVKFRAEIQGFRALCIAQVLLFHAWHVGSPIGVDVFIMISAYLLTGSLVRQAERGQVQPFWQRWVHIFKRLLPPLLVTIVGTLIAAILFLPRTRWLEVLQQSWASLFYFQNWYLQHQAVDYFAANSALQSPLMHLWSMSMQGQIFLLFPLLIWIIARVAKPAGIDVRKLSLVVFSLLALGSLYWLLTKFVAGSSAMYYFDTRSRIWEFSIGSIVAILEPRIRVSGSASTLLGWAGVGVVVVFGLVSIGTYPGPAALAPMLGAAFMLLFVRTTTSRSSVAHVLSWRPLVFLGDNSYALYLVHWPIFVLTLSALEIDTMPIPMGLGLSAVSVLVAVALTRLVDDPVRLSPRINVSAWRKLGIVGASVAVGSIVFAGVGSWMNRELSVDTFSVEEGGAGFEDGVEPYLGALVLENENGEADINTLRDGIEPIPAIADMGQEWAAYPYECEGVFANYPDFGNVANHANSCRQMFAEDGGGPRVVFWGNSHMEQYLPAFEMLAQEENWHAAALLMGGCGVATEETADQTCVDWYEASARWITEDVRPNAVVFVVTDSVAGDVDAVTPGAVSFVERSNDAGVAAIGVRDNPRFDDNPLECAASGGDVSRCGAPRAQVYSKRLPLIFEMQETLDFRFVDVSPVLCPGDWCPALMGDMYVYMDDNHLTSTFSQTLQLAMSREFESSGALDLLARAGRP